MATVKEIMEREKLNSESNKKFNSDINELMNNTFGITNITLARLLDLLAIKDNFFVIRLVRGKAIRLPGEKENLTDSFFEFGLVVKDRVLNISSVNTILDEIESKIGKRITAEELMSSRITYIESEDRFLSLYVKIN